MKLKEIQYMKHQNFCHSKRKKKRIFFKKMEPNEHAREFPTKPPPMIAMS